MKSYLVDFENVKSKGLLGIDKLDEDDHVIIFYSENSDTISFDMHCLVMQSKANIQYMKVKVGGKNALDFQLSTLLGYMVAKEMNSHIFIISNDKGFDKLHDFWQNTFDDAPVCVVFRTCNIISAINFANYNTRKMTMNLAEQEQNIHEQENISQHSEANVAERNNTLPARESLAESTENEGLVKPELEAVKETAKNASETVLEAQKSNAEESVKENETAEPEKKPAKRRGRPRKTPNADEPQKTEKTPDQATAASVAEKKTVKRGRPRKSTSASAENSARKTASKTTRKRTKTNTSSEQTSNGANNAENKTLESTVPQ